MERMEGAYGFVGSAPGHEVVDLVADLVDLEAGDKNAEQLQHQREVIGLKGYGRLAEIWNDYKENHDRQKLYAPSDIAIEAHNIVRTRDSDAALALLYTILQRRLL